MMKKKYLILTLIQTFVFTFFRRYLIILKKLILKNVTTQMVVLQLRNNKSLKRLYMSQISPKKCLQNTRFSVQLPYIAGHSL